MIRVVCLDLMGTVVSDPYLEALQAATGLSVADAHAVKDPDSWPLFECGTIDEAEFVRRFFADPAQGRTLDIEAFHRVRRAGYAFLPGMAELLDELQGTVECHLASNYPVWIDELGEVFEFHRSFDKVFASCHLGVRKPDPAFYEAMLAEIGRPAEQCLFVDDRRVNCDAAVAAGMQAHHFTGAEGLRRRLVREGVLVGA